MNMAGPKPTRNPLLDSPDALLGAIEGNEDARKEREEMMDKYDLWDEDHESPYEDEDEKGDEL